jgi:hypothetical protein
MKRFFKPPQETFIMRRMGAAFDPETICEYTGARLWKFPADHGDGERALMGYYRESDGMLVSVRNLTPQELLWITGNPEAFTIEESKFKHWLDQVRAKSQI